MQAYNVTDLAINAEDEFGGCALGAVPLLQMSKYLANDDINKFPLGASTYSGVVISNTSFLNDERVGGGKISYSMVVNETSTHGSAITMNIVNSAILQMVRGNPEARIVTRNYPLPASFFESNAEQIANALTASMMVMIAFCFLPASYAIFVVKEREVKAKHQQMISGVSIYAYWFSTFLWDAVSYLAPFSLTLLLIYYFKVSETNELIKNKTETN